MADLHKRTTIIGGHVLNRTSQLDVLPCIKAFIYTLITFYEIKAKHVATHIHTFPGGAELAKSCLGSGLTSTKFIEARYLCWHLVHAPC